MRTRLGCKESRKVHVQILTCSESTRAKAALGFILRTRASISEKENCERLLHDHQEAPARVKSGEGTSEKDR